MPASTSRRATPTGVERALGGGTLPPALVVRRVNGHGGQPMLACTSPRATPKGVERAPGGGTLPPALVVRRVNGHGDQPMPACTSPRTPPRRGIGVRTRQRYLAAATPEGLVRCLKLLRKTCKIGTL